MDAILGVSAMMQIFLVSLRVVFFLAAFLLITIVLLQEGKGGGLAAALGGQGAETFGVATGGVNRVTLTLAGVFLFSALAYAVATKESPVTGGGSRPGTEETTGGGEKKKPG